MRGNENQGSSGLLARLGVDEIAESVWRDLLANPEATAADVRQRASITSTELDAALSKLASLDLVRSAPTPTGVTVTDPGLAIEAHIVRAERQASEQAEAFAHLRSQLPLLASAYSHGKADAGETPGFEIVVPVADIRRQVSLLGSAAQHDVRSVEHGPPNVDISEGREMQIALLRRGVRDRLILDAEAVNNRHLYEFYEDYQKYGHRTRTLPQMHHRMIVFDDSVAVLPLDPTRMALGAIFIRVKSVIELLSMLFDHLWTVATPLFDEPEALGAPTGRPARILELLAIGNTDGRIARTLGIGERTIRREVADLKAMLDVNSRAELSAAAIRKGWI